MMLRRPMTRRSFIGTATALGAGLPSLLAACSGPEDERPLDSEQTVGPTNPVAQPIGTEADALDPTNPSSPGTVDLGAEQDADDATATGTGGVLTPTPMVGGVDRLSILIDPTVSVAMRGRAEALVNRVVSQVGATAFAPDDLEAANADLVIVPVSGNDVDANLPISHVDFVGVVSRRLLVREITSDQLRALWDGSITDWSDLGSPVSHGVLRVSVLGSAGPFDSAKADRDMFTLDDLAATLLAERGGVAIIPIDDIDFRMRTLNLDGVNFLRPGDAVSPLRMSLQIRQRDTSRTDLLDRVKAAIAPESGPTPVSMTWAGDIIIARQVQRRIYETGDWAAPFRTIAPELTWADITISNLETSLTDSFDPITDPTTFTFSTSEAAIEGLQLAQIDVLSRANNHSFNWGVQGMEDTSRVLDDAGILHFGMGNNLDEARQPTIVEAGGVSYAFLGYNGISDDWDGATPDSPGTCPLIDWMVVEDIKSEVANGHVVIPFFHWGTEYVYDPSEEQRYFAHIAIDAGAAVVMGSHPHWVQAVETYEGRPIVYSLGNFVFDQEWSLETKQGMIAHLWMQGDKPLKLDIAPILIEDYHKPRLMNPSEAWNLLENVWSASDWLIQNG